MAASTAQPHSSFLINLPGPCEHKASLGCMLTALPCCCSCADRRPQATAYPMYIDGQGMRMKGRRWQRYCRKCHDHWQSLVSEPDPSATSHILNTASTAPTVAELADTQATSAMPSTRHVSRTNPTQLRNEPIHHTGGHSRDSSFNADWSLQNLQLSNTATSSRRYNYHNTRSDPQAHQQEATPHGHPATHRAFPLGTREEAQQDDYSSPIGDMFNRAWTHYRDVQQAREAYRRAEQNVAAGMQNTLQSASAADSVMTPEHGHLFDARWVNADSALRQNPFLQASEPILPAAPMVRPIGGRSNFHRQLYMSNPFDALPRDRRDFSRVFGEDDPSDERSVIDKQTRPEPIAETDLKVDFACKVCREQKIDTICFPCMHACMCRWCAEIWKKGCRTEDNRFDKSLWTCPTCRKNVKESRRFFI